jgi:hypothetical protein
MLPLTGRLLWHQLHRTAHALPDSPWSEQTRDAVRAFLQAWEQAVEDASHGQCPCSSHWQALKAARPPDLTSRQAFYWWTVRIHDDVNARLNRPRLYPALA